MSKKIKNVMETGKLPKGTLNTTPAQADEVELTEEQAALARVRLREAETKRLDKAAMMELRTRMLLRNALVSKSGQTLADTEVLKHLASRLGYDLDALAQLDITDPAVNPYAKM